MPTKATYEYKTISIPQGTLPAAIDALLNAQGADGWRLVAVSTDTKDGGTQGDQFAYFEKKTTALFDSTKGN
jgi:hypothetical protein